MIGMQLFLILLGIIGIAVGCFLICEALDELDRLFEGSDDEH